MRTDMELTEYASKREFERTPEPKPGLHPKGHRLIFVVHKHAARALHYDLRLEMEGVLKSWAVPRGPSLDPSLKRLAVMVEDHPLDYKDFEGIIPEGNYGAGSVIIWDRGFYHHPSARDENEGDKLLLEGFRKGNMKFVLEGEKLHGEFALVKTGKDGKSWLLLKKKDGNATKGDILKENRSVVSRKTLEEMIEADRSKSFRQKKLNQIRLPKSGRETRQMIKDAAGKAGEYAGQVKKKAISVVENGKDLFQGEKTVLAKAIDAGKEAYKKEKESLVRAQ